MNWKDKVTVAPAQVPTFKEPTPTPSELRAAAERWSKRTDSFANGKDLTCQGMAEALERYGSYASDKQQAYAAKLVAWSLPRERPAAPAPVEAQPGSPHFDGAAAWNAVPPAALPTLPVPDLFAVMQKHSTLYVNSFRIHRKNQDTLCWILHDDALVGKIDNGVATVWPNKAVNAGVLTQTVIDLLKEFEADPLGAAMKWGKLAGRCCSCGRDLTDPESIERGIGPVCATKFGGF